MNTRLDPRELALILCNRSACRIKMAAVLSDKHGVFSWGWNSSGYSGMGQCAEDHAISRANRNRLKGATITIAGKGRNTVCSFPCKNCLELIISKGVKYVEWMDKVGVWNVSSGS